MSPVDRMPWVQSEMRSELVKRRDAVGWLGLLVGHSSVHALLEVHLAVESKKEIVLHSTVWEGASQHGELHRWDVTM